MTGEGKPVPRREEVTSNSGREDQEEKRRRTEDEKKDSTQDLPWNLRKIAKPKPARVVMARAVHPANTVAKRVRPKKESKSTEYLTRYRCGNGILPDPLWKGILLWSGRTGQRKRGTWRSWLRGRRKTGHGDGQRLREERGPRRQRPLLQPGRKGDQVGSWIGRQSRGPDVLRLVPRWSSRRHPEFHYNTVAGGRGPSRS